MTKMDWGCGFMQNISIKIQSAWLWIVTSHHQAELSSAHEWGERMLKGRTTQASPFHLYCWQDCVSIFMQMKLGANVVLGTITVWMLASWTDFKSRWEQRFQGLSQQEFALFLLSKGVSVKLKVMKLQSRKGKEESERSTAFLPDLPEEEAWLSLNLVFRYFGDSGKLSQNEVLWQDIEFRHAEVDG